MIVSLSIIETLNEFIERTVEIKWPNDIVVNRKKIAGILIENKYRGGSVTESFLGIGLNLNQKIYKRFYQFKDFQFIMIQPKGTSELAKNLQNDLKTGTDTDLVNWKFISLEDQALSEIFNSLKTNLTLDSNLGTPYVFIIDRDANLRGRDDKEGVKFGYDSRFVADINNNMVDDVKVILAEYRMALKKNNIYKDEL